MKGMKVRPPLIAAILLLAMGMIYGLAGITKVDPGETGILIKVLGIDRGMKDETLDIGYRWVEPFSYDVVVYNTREVQQEKMSGMAAGTKDGQPIAVDLSLQTGLVSSSVPHLHVRVGPDYYNKIVFPAMRDIIRNSTGAVLSDVIYTQEGRQRVQKDIEAQLKARFGQYGITFAANVRDVRFENAAFIATLEEKAAAAQRIEIESRNAAAAEQAAIRVANIAEGQKQKAIKEAEANSEMLRLQGLGERQQKEEQAKGILAVGQAEAEAIRLKNAALSGPGGSVYASIEWAKNLGPNVKILGYPLGAPGTTGLFMPEGVLGDALKIKGTEAVTGQ